MSVVFKPIGYVRTTATTLPRHWSVSDVEGELVLEESYTLGLQGIQEGSRIVVLFHFHESTPFSPDSLLQRPPHAHGRKKGVFATCSPHRPNAIGLSVVTVLHINGNVIGVKGIDMRNKTPILDIKPDIDA
ncbi:tRNA (N6-threonylcarbamoyladenosine(37)-N6)-methyltransferase TrmO [Desulfoplanes formicivorans]|uniref:Methyltransferase n=1 Tax=Desulfoplanes formicivorans TaxID=1592317 RepID=A0A194AIN6_9BACT|nr:tRNA (N6-threonylcarbamoyladenosine(37)-N6)-methyltransferase TrmO [Desulfoplanes formicivorans]GAU08936.1 methyltransferase [Desulfoplanes formicivorans]